MLRVALTSIDRSYDGTVDIPDQTYRKAISKLLSTLLGEEAAFNLRSKTTALNITYDLSLIFVHVQDGEFKYEQYRALSQLAIQNAPDIDIWNAVVDLITNVSQLTPPSTLPPSSDNTPINYSSASQQGSEQTRALVEERVFEEIRSCTYCDVEEFFAKYLEGKEWTCRTLDIYNAMKDRHVNGMWTGFPDPPVQAQVLDWWFQFQNGFLSEERRCYYSTAKPTDLVGVEGKWQIDLFLKRKDGQPRGVAHDWRDVNVIGEFKQSNGNKKGTHLQIGRYVRDVVSQHAGIFMRLQSAGVIWSFGYLTAQDVTVLVHLISMRSQNGLYR